MSLPNYLNPMLRWIMGCVRRRYKAISAGFSIVILLIALGGCGSEDVDDNNGLVNQEEPNQEEPNQEEPNQEEPNQEEPNQEGPNQEEPNQEEPNQEEPNQEEPNQEEPNQEEPNQEEPNQEEPGPSVDSPVLDMSACGPVVDIGELSFGMHEVEIDVDDYGGGVDEEISCETFSGNTFQILIKLETPLAATGTFQAVLSNDVSMEVRTGDDCSRSGLNTSCQMAGFFEAYLGPGATHYVIMEKPQDPSGGMISWEFSYEQLESCPLDLLGTASCIDSNTSVESCDVIIESADIPRWTINQCPTEQCQNDRCIGNSCDQPIEVVDEFHWIGNNKGFSNTTTIADEVMSVPDGEATCQDSEVPDPLVVTAGREMIFKLVDMQEGEEVTIEVDTNTNSNLVLVKGDCASAAQCQEAWENRDEVLEFEAPDSGDFFVIIDSLYDIDANYDISIVRD